MIKRFQPGNPCDCTTLADCLVGKCVNVIFDNVANHASGTHPCDCCNTFFSRTLNVGPIRKIGHCYTCQIEGDYFERIFPCHCLPALPLFGSIFIPPDVGFEITKDCAHGNSLRVSVSLPVYNAPSTAVIISETASFGADAGHDAQIEDWIRSLCAGGTITLPLISFAMTDGTSNYPCEFSGATVRVAIADCVDPTPPPSPCDALTTCSDLPALKLEFSQFMNCDYIEPTPDYGITRVHELWEVLNEVSGIGPIFNLIPGTNPISNCFSSAGGTMPFYIYLGRPDTPDYTDPGLKVSYTEYFAFPYKKETYIYAINLWLKCEGDGDVRIAQIGFDTQTFEAEPDGEPYLTNYDCISVDMPCGTDTPSAAGDCAVLGQMIRDFSYPQCQGVGCFRATASLP